MLKTYIESKWLMIMFEKKIFYFKKRLVIDFRILWELSSRFYNFNLHHCGTERKTPIISINSWICYQIRANLKGDLWKSFSLQEENFY